GWPQLEFPGFPRLRRLSYPRDHRDYKLRRRRYGDVALRSRHRCGCAWGTGRAHYTKVTRQTAPSLLVAFSFASTPALADQGGISFWLPGAFGSLAAAPLTPGLTLGGIYLHSDVSAGGDVAASRALRFPNRTINLNINLDAT